MMPDARTRFQCPTCLGILSEATGGCLGCGRNYLTHDGIFDFVGGQFDTQLDVAGYDASHTIGDDSAEIQYQRHRRLAAQRWPASLGSVIEIGCGTGLFSRSMIRHGDAKDAVLTDVSLDMLRLCRGHIGRLGAAGAPPVHFATYSANEACFRDDMFDTCAGASVVHHIADVRAFLHDVCRFLRPGGRAFFVEPSLRYHRVMAMTFADIIAMILARDSTPTPDRQALHNWVAEARRGIVLQGDPALLAGYEDKHMFDGDAFEAIALEAGFATAEALPSTPDPDGMSSIGGLLARLQVGEPLAEQVTRLWPSYAERYLRLLNAKDLSLGYLFWLTKSDRACPVTVPIREQPSELLSATEEEITGGGLPLRWVLEFGGETTPAGLHLKVMGWCLANADIKSVRIAIDGVGRQTPVWLPRADVHIALNGNGAYIALNSLCCGVSDQLVFDHVHPSSQACAVSVDLVFRDNRCVTIVANERMDLGKPFSVGR